MKAEIKTSICKASDCKKCLAREACDLRAIIFLDDEPAFIQESICDGCGLCIKECPLGAVFLKS